MEKTATHYLFEALFVLKANLSYVFIPVILSSGFYLTLFVPKNLQLLFFFTIGIALFISMPLIYGQFIEIIITGQKDTWLNVYNNYWMKVFLVSLILKAPSILLSSVDSKMNTVMEIISFTIEVASIYILPLVLLRKEMFSSFKLGIKCLLGNLKFNTPIIFVLTLSIFFPILLTGITKNLDIKFLSFIFSIIIIFFATLFEFAIFIAASLILKEKLFMTFQEDV